MPKRGLAELAATAMARGLDPATPAIAVAAATRPEQQIIMATISDIAERLRHAAPEGPVVVMIGPALAHRARNNTNTGQRNRRGLSGHTVA